MRDLTWQLRQLARHNRDGSQMTQAQRAQILTRCAEQLHEAGYRGMAARSLKPKHVEALVERWRGEELSTGTIKNRLAAVRWWAEKVGKSSVVARENAHYGLPDRSFTAQTSKAADLPDARLAAVRDERVAMSLRLQAAFGLRREEGLKLTPAGADRGERLALRASWCKGGRAREVPIRTPEQRALLEEAKRLAGRGSLIPAGRSYVEHRRVYERECARAGLSKMHGLRHAYAQARYRELTGLEAPACGGPSLRDLAEAERERVREARALISRELGHEREQITAAYLGR